LDHIDIANPSMDYTQSNFCRNPADDGSDVYACAADETAEN
jgi:hypothetical protein